ncbi:hypothetical protein B0I32_102197 [Nonomuraea fuscirosea]|uniref:Uncharacterized protein n=1 Tax=Nonomuraea fuscirosea TaxID=1291556 RepID=A0A2T0N8T6_9ACTN|nr:hypothetical protein B0I32_102197 [Nonomuraea fuscirosea]
MNLPGIWPRSDFLDIATGLRPDLSAGMAHQRSYMGSAFNHLPPISRCSSKGMRLRRR